MNLPHPLETSAHFVAEEPPDVEGNPKANAAGDVEMRSNSSAIKVLLTPYEETKQNLYDRMFKESSHFVNIQKSAASLASHQLLDTASIPGQVNDSDKQCVAGQTSSSVLFKNSTFKTTGIEYPEEACTSEFNCNKNKQQGEITGAAAAPVKMCYESATEAHERPAVTTPTNKIDNLEAKQLTDVAENSSTSIFKASATSFDESYNRIFGLRPVTDNQKAKQAGDVDVRSNASSIKVPITPYEEMKQYLYHRIFQESIHCLNIEKSRVTLASLELDTESTDVSIPVASEDSLQRLVAADSTIIAVDIDGNVIRADDESAASEAVSVEGLIEDLQNMMAVAAEQTKEIDPEDAGDDTSLNDTQFADDSSANESDAPADDNIDLDHVESTNAHSIEETDPDKDMIKAIEVVSHIPVPVSEAVNESDTTANITDASVNNVNATEVAPAVHCSSVKKAKPPKAKSAITAKIPAGNSRGESIAFVLEYPQQWPLLFPFQCF